MTTRQSGTPNVAEEGQSKKRPKKDNKKPGGKGPSEFCSDCDIEIRSDTKALSCNFCHKWVCTKCLEVPDKLYQVLVQNPKSLLLLPCKGCSGNISSLQEMRDTLTEVKVNQDGTKKQLDNLNKKMMSLKKDLQKSVKEMVKTEVDTQMSAKLVDMEEGLHEKMNEKLELLERQPAAAPMNPDLIKVLVKESYRKERLKDINKPNLMMFNVPEKNSKDRQSSIQ